MSNDIDKNNNLTVAERHYINHLKAVKKYYEKNRDKLNDKNISNYLKIKNDNDQLYNEILEQKKTHYENNKEHILSIKKQYYMDNIDAIKEKKRLYYQNVVKPKKEQEKLEKLKLLETQVF